MQARNRPHSAVLYPVEVQRCNNGMTASVMLRPLTIGRMSALQEATLSTKLLDQLDLLTLYGHVQSLCQRMAIEPTKNLVYRTIDLAWQYGAMSMAKRGRVAKDCTKDVSRFAVHALSETWLCNASVFCEWDLVAHTPILSTIAEHYSGTRAAVHLLSGRPDKQFLPRVNLCALREELPFCYALGVLVRAMQTAGGIDARVPDSECRRIARTWIQHFLTCYTDALEGGVDFDTVQSDVKEGQRYVRLLHARLAESDCSIGSKISVEPEACSELKEELLQRICDCDVLSVLSEIQLRDELTAMLSSALCTLSERQLEAWYQKMVLSRSGTEAAQDMGVSPSAYKTHLKRAWNSREMKTYQAKLRKLVAALGAKHDVMRFIDLLSMHIGREAYEAISRPAFSPCLSS